SVPRNHPAQVAGAWRSEHIADALGRRAGIEQPLDRAHGLDQSGLLSIGQPVEKAADLVARACVERREDGATVSGELKVALAAIVGRRMARDQAALEKTTQD